MWGGGGVRRTRIGHQLQKDTRERVGRGSGDGGGGGQEKLEWVMNSKRTHNRKSGKGERGGGSGEASPGH